MSLTEGAREAALAGQPGAADPGIRQLLLPLASLSAVLSFQYLPFQYVVGFLGLGKLTFFLLLVGASCALLALERVLDPARNGLSGFTPIVLSYGLFATFVLISYGAHPDHLGSSAAFMAVMVLNPVFLLMGYACRRHKATLVRGTFLLSSLYLVFVAAPVVSGLVRGGRITPDVVFQGLEMEVGFYQNVNSFLGLLVVSSLAFPGGSRALRRFILAVGLLAFLAMFVVGGRGAFLATLFVVAVHLIHRYRHRLLQDPRKVLGAVLLAGILWLVLHNLSFLMEYSETVRRLMVLTEGGDASRRAFLFSSALDLFLSDVKTLLFGGGYNGFQTYIGDFAEGMYPHNIILEVLAEYGLVGLGLFLAPVIHILRCRMRDLGGVVGRSPAEAAVFYMFLYFWAMRMVSGGMRTSWLLMFFTAILLPASERSEDPDR